MSTGEQEFWGHGQLPGLWVNAFCCPTGGLAQAAATAREKPEAGNQVAPGLLDSRQRLIATDEGASPGPHH